MRVKPAAGLIVGGILLQALAAWFTIIYGFMLFFMSVSRQLDLTNQGFMSGVGLFFGGVWVVGLIGFILMLVAIYRLASRGED